jgi:hypothetical protein
MLERALIRVATVAGVAWWLGRVMFSRTERHKLDAAMQAIDTVSFKGVDGLDYQHRIRAEWERD